jgi:hypothetical protein
VEGKDRGDSRGGTRLPFELALCLKATCYIPVPRRNVGVYRSRAVPRNINRLAVCTTDWMVVIVEEALYVVGEYTECSTR